MRSGWVGGGVTDEKGGGVQEKGGSGPPDPPPPSGHAYVQRGKKQWTFSQCHSDVPLMFVASWVETQLGCHPNQHTSFRIEQILKSNKNRRS